MESPLIEARVSTDDPIFQRRNTLPKLVTLSSPKTRAKRKKKMKKVKQKIEQFEQIEENDMDNVDLVDKRRESLLEESERILAKRVNTRIENNPSEIPSEGLENSNDHNEISHAMTKDKSGTDVSLVGPSGVPLSQEMKINLKEKAELWKRALKKANPTAHINDSPRSQVKRGSSRRMSYVVHTTDESMQEVDLQQHFSKFVTEDNSSSDISVDAQSPSKEKYSPGKKKTGFSTPKKSLFQKTATLAMKKSMAGLEKNSDDDEENVRTTTRAKYVYKEMKDAAERAERIYKGEDDGGLNKNKPRWSRVIEAAVDRFEGALPKVVAKVGQLEDGHADMKMKDILENIKETMKEEGISEVKPEVNGLRQFGVTKQGIARAVVKFSQPPSLHPFTVCFHFPHSFLNHKYVKHMVLSKIRNIDNAQILTIQFQDRNVFHGTRSLDNRWIIRVSPMDAFDLLVQQGIMVCNRKIGIRPYDDVLQDEYQEFIEYVQMQKRFMFDKLEELTGEMPKQAQNVIHNMTLDLIPDPERQFLDTVKVTTKPLSYVEKIESAKLRKSASPTQRDLRSSGSSVSQVRGEIGREAESSKSQRNGSGSKSQRTGSGSKSQRTGSGSKSQRTGSGIAFGRVGTGLSRLHTADSGIGSLKTGSEISRFQRTSEGSRIVSGAIRYKKGDEDGDFVRPEQTTDLLQTEKFKSYPEEDGASIDELLF